MGIRCFGMLLLVAAIMYWILAGILTYMSFSIGMHKYIERNPTLLVMIIGMYLSSPMMAASSVFTIWVVLREKMVWALFGVFIGSSIWFGIGEEYFRSVSSSDVLDVIWDGLNLDRRRLEDFQKKYTCCGYDDYTFWCLKSGSCDKTHDLPISCYYGGLRVERNVINDVCKDKILSVAKDFVGSSKTMLYACFAISILLTVASFLFAWVVTVWPKEDYCIPDCATPCAQPYIPPCMPPCIQTCSSSMISTYGSNCIQGQSKCQCSNNEFCSNPMTYRYQ